MSLSSSSTHDKVEGNLKKAEGKVRRIFFFFFFFASLKPTFFFFLQVKETVGHAVGNERLEAEGKAKHFEGQVEVKTGEVKQVFGQ